MYINKPVIYSNDTYNNDIHDRLALRTPVRLKCPVPVAVSHLRLIFSHYLQPGCTDSRYITYANEPCDTSQVYS